MRSFQGKKLYLYGISILFSFFSFLPVVRSVDANLDMLVYRDSVSANMVYKTRNMDGVWSVEHLLPSFWSVGSTWLSFSSKPDTTTNDFVLCLQQSTSSRDCIVATNTGIWEDNVDLGVGGGTSYSVFVEYEQLSGEAVVCYRINSPGNTPRCRTWNGSVWSSTVSATATVANIAHMKLIPDPNSNDMMLMIKDTSDDVYIERWDGDTNTFANPITVETAGGANNFTLAYDGAWESATGDFVAVWFSDSDNELEARQFTAATTTWEAETVALTGLGALDGIKHVRVTADPTSDIVLAGVLDTDESLEVIPWTGSAWDAKTVIANPVAGSVSNVNRFFDILFEATTNNAIITYGQTANSLKYRVWNGASWDSEQSLPTAYQAVSWHDLAADLNSDNIMLTIKGSNGTTGSIETLEWSGTAWDGSFLQHELSSNIVTYHNAFFEYSSDTTPDTSDPVLQSWVLDMNAQEIELSFDEAMDTETIIDPTTITIQNAATATQSYTLTGGTVQAPQYHQTVVIKLTTEDVVALHANPLLATGTSNSYIRMTAANDFEDMSGNTAGAIADGSAMQATSFIADTTKPILQSWIVNLEDEYMEMVFSEAIDVSATTFASHILQDAATATSSQTLSANSTIPTSDDTTVRIDFGPIDFSNIESNGVILQSLATSYLRFSVNAVRDMVGNGIAAISNGSAVQASEYIGNKVYTQSAFRFFDNTNTTDVGSALAAQDTSAVLATDGAQFRLRMLIDVANDPLSVSEDEFTLQYAVRSGTCDIGFSGESYSDVTASTTIAFADNAAVSDGNSATSNVNDPTHGAHPVIYQSYEEANPFSNSSAIAVSQDGLWDFSLKDNNGSNSTTYCFRVVRSTGDVLDTYSVIPQISTISSNTLPTAVSATLMNGDASIDLSPGTITPITATVTITDSDFCSTITDVSAVLYRSGVGEVGIFNGSNRYNMICEEDIGSCGVADTEATYTCSVDMQYFAQPTDAGSPYPSENWLVSITPSDTVGAGTASVDSIEVNTLVAVDTSASVNYGTLSLGQTTGATNQTITTQNQGNIPIDIFVSGYGALAGDGTSFACTTGTIPVSNVEYATSAFTYTAGTDLSATPVEVDTTLLPSEGSVSQLELYTGVSIPASGVGGACSGILSVTGNADPNQD